ncbi:inactive leucine-rich repeat receptor-like serine/threonine-protein kinase At1g60630 [Bidens hawaiensis]|uniref:inactive leucine-rich repeat receptor-like serine/threonine-protein kinase At1g60630 n=1 Tax=Bidens hawaiensis TaxID=980011 RepID=UPI00404B1627
MKIIPVWILFLSLFLLTNTAKSVDVEAIRSLVGFFENLSRNFSQSVPVSGWNRTSDPCMSKWTGIMCYDQIPSVKSIVLNDFNLSGTFNPSIICNVASLSTSIAVISLEDNNLHGESFDTIANCKSLTHLYISHNKFSGTLPDSLSRLSNLKKLEISDNGFSGSLPSLARISGLIEFTAQNNQLSGPIPEFDFLNLVSFNVSNNDFSGPIPQGGDRFTATSYFGNPRLCGDPLPDKCEDPDSAAQNSNVSGESTKNGPTSTEILMYSGYALVGLIVLLIIMFKVCKRGKKQEEVIKEIDHKDVSTAYTFASNEFKSVGMSKSEGYNGTSFESGPVSSSLIVLTSPEVNGLKFEELLKAPAELLGRGKHGSVYKVNCEEHHMTLAVKRIKDWVLPSNDFKLRMKRLNIVKHPNVLPVVAFYCSRQEKLLVYEYQPNGSLLKLLHGMSTGQTFDWSSRIGVACAIADALAFMHNELHPDGIAHGNLKSSNILFNKNMEPSISEYGLMTMNNTDSSPLISDTFQHSNGDQNESAFRADIHALGVIFLELLTGKMPMVENNGMDLATWVVSVVKEEWTVEVFDRALIREGASEERMVNLLQIAIKCVDRSPDSRPGINQVAVMVNNIKEEDDRSMDVSESPFSMRR